MYDANHYLTHYKRTAQIYLDQYRRTGSHICLHYAISATRHALKIVAGHKQYGGFGNETVRG